jgi:putative ABC transport system ATP-binding protein
MILEVAHLHKSFVGTTSEPLTILHDISFSLEKGASCALVGPSGSGKTTLLGLCAGLDAPTSGSVLFDGENLSSASENRRALVRRSRMGFVFQNFQLVPTLTAIENVTLPLELAGAPFSEAKRKAFPLLERVGLADRAHHLPFQLSGGEQQRVALSRALVHAPSILFADEPTGNLDAENSEKITNLLFSMNREAGTALVLVTHNQELANLTGSVLSLKGGRLVC